MHPLILSSVWECVLGYGVNKTFFFPPFKDRFRTISTMIS